jgi:hypothetical protein
LVLDTIPRVIKCVDFIQPEGFFVKGVKSQGEPYEETEDEDKNFFLIYHIRSWERVLKISLGFVTLKCHSIGISISFSFGDRGSNRKRYMDASIGNLLKLRKLPSKYPLRKKIELFLISVAIVLFTTSHSRFPSAMYWCQ